MLGILCLVTCQFLQATIGHMVDMVKMAKIFVLARFGTNLRKTSMMSSARASTIVLSGRQRTSVADLYYLRLTQWRWLCVGFDRSVCLGAHRFSDIRRK